MPEDAYDILRREVGLLDVEDILGLCFSFARNPLRLRLYQDVLREKGGTRAQAAATLICFDRAENGDAQAQAEFFSLVPVMIELRDAPRDASGKRPIDHLLGADLFLQTLWHDLENRLGELDPRAPEQVIEIDVDDSDVFEIDLFDDDDVGEIDFDDFVDAARDALAMAQSWEASLASFLRRPSTAASVASNVMGGFIVEDQADLERVDRFCRDAESFETLVPMARAMLPLVELFQASHLRARNFFGRRNQERLALVASGLTHFSQLALPPHQEAAWLTSPTAANFAWEKVAELLLDYISFLGELEHQEVAFKMDAASLAQAYLNAKRPQPPPARLAVGDKRRRR